MFSVLVIAGMWMVLWLSNVDDVTFTTSLVGRSVGRVEPINCYENDKGIDYYRWGKGVYSYNDVLNSYERQFFQDRCVDKKVIKEFYCTPERKLVELVYNCPQGCSDGECNPLPAIRSCFATDDGVDYVVPGEVSITFSDGSTTTAGEEFCKGDVLHESYCTASNSDASIQMYTCPFGCRDGACLPTPAGEQGRTIILSCVDSDGGKGYDRAGIVSATLDIDGSISVTNYRDRCTDPDMINEVYCDYKSNSLVAASVKVSCATEFGPRYMCYNGECVERK